MKRLHYKRPVGRPRSGKFTRSIFVTDVEHAKVVAFLAKLRAEAAKGEK